MNRICFVNGSPRGKISCSAALISDMVGMLDEKNSEIHELCIIESLKHKDIQNDFEKLVKMDSIIFVFPLYIDAVPSSMLDYLYRFEEYIKKSKGNIEPQKRPGMYAVINNGFIEGSQNVNAARIMAHYADEIGFVWRFAIGIGAGEFIKDTHKSIPLKSKMKMKIYEAVVKLVKDIKTNEVSQQKDMLVSPAMPKQFFMLAANMHWPKAAKKSRKELSARPY